MNINDYLNKKNLYSAAISIIPSVLAFAMLKLLLLHLTSTQYADYTIFLVWVSFSNSFIASPYINFLKVQHFDQNNTLVTSPYPIILLIILLTIPCNIALTALFSAFHGNFIFAAFVCIYQLSFAIYNYQLFVLNKDNSLPKLLIMNVVPSLISLIFVVLFLLLGGKNDYFLFGLSVIGYFIAWVTFKLKVRFISLAELIKLFTTSLPYIFPLAMYNLLVWFNSSLGRLYINEYYTAADLAVFGSFQLIVTKIYAVIASITLIRFTADLFESKNINKALIVNLKLYIGLSFLFLIVIAIFNQFWISLLFTKAFVVHWKVFIFINVTYFLCSLISLLEQVFYYNKRVNVLVINFILGNSIIFCGIKLLPIAGVNGVVSAYFLGFLSMCLYLLYEWKKSNRTDRVNK